jgi:hypothetical protein
MLLYLTRKRFVWLGVAVIVVTLSYAAIVLTPWSIGPCGEEEGIQTYSPDGKHLAQVFIRSCGATTGWLTHVNLRSRWGYFNPRWEGIIRQDEVFSISCWSRVNLVWKDNANLEIQHPDCKRCDNGQDGASRERNSWRGITITYRALPCDVALNEAAH